MNKNNNENTILIVDDELPLRQVLQDKFQREGFSVITASNGQEGFEKAKQQKPNIILMDIMMPLVNGFSMINLLRKEPDTKNIPVVVLTNFSEYQQKLAPVQDFLLKNEWKMEHLVEHIKKGYKKYFKVIGNVTP